MPEGARSARLRPCTSGTAGIGFSMIDRRACFAGDGLDAGGGLKCAGLSGCCCDGGGPGGGTNAGGFAAGSGLDGAGLDGGGPGGGTKAGGLCTCGGGPGGGANWGAA